MKFLKKFRKGQKGFTLIELLVVIAILGVIAAVAVPNVLKFMDNGQQEAARAEQHNLQVAVAAYMYDNPTVAPTDAALGPGDTGVFGAYLINDLSFTWAVDVNGAVSPIDPAGAPDTNPLI